MKEIDFIPEWYKADLVRKRRYARQYTIIAVIFAVMMVWSFIVGHHVNHVGAEVEGVQAAFAKGRDKVRQTQLLQSEIAEMKQKAAVLDTITSRTKITAILGELAYLVQENIILDRLSLMNEPIEELKKETPASGAVVQIGGSKEQQNAVVPKTPSRLKVTLSGIAARPADAAVLIAGLEQADYFQQVALVFSRPKKFMDNDVTEFEICCYVADYRIQK
ncbi:MAG: PilN domain-containing protein [Phycisphaerae bacterium]|nr:PilN domain-containing protein [Phycisphaerae bacterium]